MTPGRGISSLPPLLLIVLALALSTPTAWAASTGKTVEASHATVAGVETISTGSEVAGTFAADVAAEDAVFIQYREGTTGLSAEIGYRSNTGTNALSSLKTRTWNGSAWSGETEQATAGSPLRAVRMAWSPVDAATRIFVTESDDGWLDAYVCGAACSVTNNIGQVWSAAPGTPQKRFDIAYESVSGEALLVYGVLSTDATRDIAFRTYLGGTWSAEQYLDDTGHGSDVQYSLIKLASAKGSDEIGLVGGDSTNSDINAWVWDGSAFGNFVEINPSSENPDEEQAAIAWESGSSDLVVVSINSGATTCGSKEFTTSWSAATTFTCGGTNPVRWLSLKANPVATADDMILAVGDNDPGLSTVHWTGSAWDSRTSQDTGIDSSNTRAFDFAWEASGANGLLVWGTAAGQITYRTYSAPSTWGTVTNVAMGSVTHRWVELRTNPLPGAGVGKIYGAILETSNNDLGAVSWDGSTFSVVGASTFSPDTLTSTQDHFDFGFSAMGDDRLAVQYNWTSVPAGDSYVLRVKGYRGDENLAVQVLTPPSTWTTRLTISSTTNTLYTYDLTPAEYNAGSPAIRFADASGTQGSQSDFWIDLAVVETQSGGPLPPTPPILPPTVPFLDLIAQNFLLFAIIAAAVGVLVVAIVAGRRRSRRKPTKHKGKGARNGSRKRSGARRPAKPVRSVEAEEPMASPDEKA